MAKSTSLSETKGLLGLTATMVIGFLISFLLTAFRQDLSSDDFYFAEYLYNNSIWESVQIERDTWNSRWASLLLNFSLLSLHNSTSIFLLTYSILNISLAYLIAKQWSKGYANPIIISGFLTYFIFIGTFDIGEVWFWLCSTTAYLTSTLMLVYIFQSLKDRISISLGLLFIPMIVYIGGSSMPIALVALFLLLKSLVNQLKGDQQNIQWMVLFTVTLLISLLYLLNGQGSYKRQLAFDMVPLMDLPFLHIKLVVLILWKTIIPKTLFLLVIGTPFLFLPSNLPPISAGKLTGQLLFYTISFLAALTIYQGIFTYITNDISADRSLYPVNILLIYSTFKSLQSLHQFLKQKPIPYIVKGLLVILAISVSGFYLWNNISKDMEYRSAFKQTMSQLKVGKTTVNLLPESGFIYPTTISSDSTYFTNQHLKRYFNLNKTPIANDTNR